MDLNVTPQSDSQTYQALQQQVATIQSQRAALQYKHNLIRNTRRATSDHMEMPLPVEQMPQIPPKDLALIFKTTHNCPETAVKALRDFFNRNPAPSQTMENAIRMTLPPEALTYWHRLLETLSFNEALTQLSRTYATQRTIQESQLELTNFSWDNSTNLRQTIAKYDLLYHEANRSNDLKLNPMVKEICRQERIKSLLDPEMAKKLQTTIYEHSLKGLTMTSDQMIDYVNHHLLLKDPKKAYLAIPATITANVGTPSAPHDKDGRGRSRQKSASPTDQRDRNRHRSRDRRDQARQDQLHRLRSTSPVYNTTPNTSYPNKPSDKSPRGTVQNNRYSPYTRTNSPATQQPYRRDTNTPVRDSRSRSSSNQRYTPYNSNRNYQSQYGQRSSSQDRNKYYDNTQSHRPSRTPWTRNPQTTGSNPTSRNNSQSRPWNTYNNNTNKTYNNTDSRPRNNYSTRIHLPDDFTRSSYQIRRQTPSPNQQPGTHTYVVETNSSISMQPSTQQNFRNRTSSPSPQRNYSQDRSSSRGRSPTQYRSQRSQSADNANQHTN